jgi:hypothetical protein
MFSGAVQDGIPLAIQNNIIPISHVIPPDNGPGEVGNKYRL